VGHAEQVSQHIGIGAGKANQHGGVSCVVVGQAMHQEERRAVRREAPKSTPMTSESSEPTIAVSLGNCYSQSDRRLDVPDDSDFSGHKPQNVVRRPVRQLLAPDQ
jgi:hypothetical protein